MDQDQWKQKRAELDVHSRIAKDCPQTASRPSQLRISSPKPCLLPILPSATLSLFPFHQPQNHTPEVRTNTSKIKGSLVQILKTLTGWTRVGGILLAGITSGHEIAADVDGAGIAAGGG